MIARGYGPCVAVGGLLLAVLVGTPAPTEPRAAGATTVRHAAAQDVSPPLAALLTGQRGHEPTPPGPGPVTADDLIWGVAYQLADLNRLITLEPGDVVLTGTPANSRPMEPGDVVAVEIDALGRVENTVVDWNVDLSGPGADDG